MKKREADFTKKTKNIIASRAGYQCSFLGCSIATIGPGFQSNEFSSTGTAAHIFSASEGGPRGNGGLLKDDLMRPENGIWLCEIHGKYIDTNRGMKFPATLLYSYKNLHEERILREQVGITSPFGWLQSITILDSPIISSNQNINFGKVTLIIGMNSTGKTALSEWLNGISDVSRLMRWLWQKNLNKKIEYEIKFFNPEEKTINVQIDKNNVRYKVNKSDLPYNLFSPKIIHLKYPDISMSEKLSDLEVLSKALGIDPIILRNFIPQLGKIAKGYVKKASILEDKEEQKEFLIVDDLKFKSLSGGQKSRVAIELAITIASMTSEFQSTFLIIDGAFNTLDKSGKEFYASYLSSSQSKFQSLITLVDNGATFNLDWSGWVMARLAGEAPLITIES